MEESVMITKEEALRIFAFYKYSPLNLIKEKRDEINEETQVSFFRDIRWMIKIADIYLSYKSSLVWFLVSQNCKQFINEIYKTDETIITFKELSFLVWFIFIHRNIKDYRKINKLSIDNIKLQAFRASLLELKAIKAYQTEMF